MSGAVVYFARSGETGLIKIGATYNVANRMSLLRSVRQGRSIELLATVPGMRPTESRFLRHYWDLHVGREWFTPAPRLMNDIARIVAGEFSLDELPHGPNPILSAAMRAAHARKRAAAA